MKKAIYIIVILAAVLGVLWYESRKETPSVVAPESDYKNLVTQIEGMDAKYFGNEVQEDFNSDGIEDVAFIMSASGGGSGTFYYIVVALRNGGIYLPVGAVFLGDRISPQTTEFRDGEIVVNYADRKPTESMSVEQSIGVSKYFKVLDGKLVQVYHDPAGKFSIVYPENYTIDALYKNGVKFIIPKNLAEGTNLSSSDTGLSIEQIPGGKECRGDLFLDHEDKTSEVSDENLKYSVVESNGAAAGNRYEEKIWAISGSNPCIAVRYFIHWANIGNYPLGTVHEFNHDELISSFDQMRRSLKLTK